MARFIEHMIEVSRLRRRLTEQTRPSALCSDCGNSVDGTCRVCGRPCIPERPACGNFTANDKLMAAAHPHWDPPLGCTPAEFQEFVATLQPGERVVECSQGNWARRKGTIHVSSADHGNVRVVWDSSDGTGAPLASPVTPKTRRLSLHDATPA